jgi:hypothetical protein
MMMQQQQQQQQMQMMMMFMSGGRLPPHVAPAAYPHYAVSPPFVAFPSAENNFRSPEDKN